MNVINITDCYASNTVPYSTLVARLPSSRSSQLLTLALLITTEPNLQRTKRKSYTKN